MHPVFMIKRTIETNAANPAYPHLRRHPYPYRPGTSTTIRLHQIRWLPPTELIHNILRLKLLILGIGRLLGKPLHQFRY